MNSLWLTAGGLFVLVLIVRSFSNQTKQKRKTVRRKPSQKSNSTRNTSTTVRSDELILTTPLDQLSGFEFERLLALYFRDQGYQVEETGVGGSDGGVDLVLVDRRGERTAVQAKCYADHNKVDVKVVRELVGAKRNHNCVLTLLITTSDLTAPAKKEAEQFHVDYWHGGLVERKLAAWGKYKPKQKTKQQPKRTTRQEVAVTQEVTCQCGSTMVVRKNREGVSFYGCSEYPRCRHTKSIR